MPVEVLEVLLKDPVNTIGGIGQSICDTADEKGVAYSSGYIVTEVVTALLADKGLDKLKNVAKTGKTADNVADIAEGAAKGAGNAAEDAGKAGKGLEGAAKGAESVAEDAGKVVEGGSKTTKISPEMEKKILEGQRKSPTKNEVIGGHSSQIDNGNDLFAVEVLSENADGTKNIKFIKDFQDGNISKIKKSTIFPDLWSESKIIASIKEVGDSPIISVRARDGATWHRAIIDGVEIDVIKIGDNVVAGYPTGKVNAPKPSGF